MTRYPHRYPVNRPYGQAPRYTTPDPLQAATAYSVGQTVTLLDTHPGDGGWSSAYVESVHGTTYGVRVQGHSLYYVTADKLDKYRGRY